MSNTDPILSQHLKARRKASGLTLFQVSERTGVSISFLSDIECGRADPSIETLRKIAACYGVSLASLLASAETLAEVQAYARHLRIRLLEIMARDIEEELAQMKEGASCHDD